MKREIGGRRAREQQAAFSFRFKHSYQSRDTWAGCHLPSPGASLPPGLGLGPVDLLRPTGGENEQLPVIRVPPQMAQGDTSSMLRPEGSLKPGQLRLGADPLPLLREAQRGHPHPTSHSAAINHCLLRAPALLQHQPRTELGHNTDFSTSTSYTYKQAETSKEDRYTIPKYFKMPIFLSSNEEINPEPVLDHVEWSILSVAWAACPVSHQAGLQPSMLQDPCKDCSGVIFRLQDSMCSRGV